MKERVLNYVRRHALMRPGDRVGVAVSGGADSVALLRLLLEARTELGIVLSVVHFNHKIRGADADADEQFVRELAQGFDLEFYSDSGDTPAYARGHKLSLEAAARKLRYSFFDRLTADSTVRRVATAHTRDDQAETVLMRFLRGSGTKGLAGIYPVVKRNPAGRISVPGEPLTVIVRPLLEVSRHELRAYLQALGQSWREDSSNADVSFTRNRLRHEIMPVLRPLNPNLDQVLSETAEIAREEESWWSTRANSALKGLRAHPKNLTAGAPGPWEVNVDSLLVQPLAMQRRLVRMFSETHGVQLDFRHVEEVLALANQTSQGRKRAELPDGWEAVREGRELWLRRACLSRQEQGFDIPLVVPGALVAAGKKIRAVLVRGEESARVPHGSGTRATQVLLHADLARQELRVRNWHAGDRYWPAHTSAPKKLKELLQARHIPREQKAFWPVVVSGEEIVWVPGFAAPEQFRVRDKDSEALLLEELPPGQSGGIEP